MSFARLMRCAKLSMSSRHRSVNTAHSVSVQVMSDRPGSRQDLILLTCGVKSRLRSGTMLRIAVLYLGKICF